MERRRGRLGDAEEGRGSWPERRPPTAACIAPAVEHMHRLAATTNPGGEPGWPVRFVGAGAGGADVFIRVSGARSPSRSPRSAGLAMAVGFVGSHTMSPRSSTHRAWTSVNSLMVS